jgi:hypothetical protein
MSVACSTTSFADDIIPISRSLIESNNLPRRNESLKGNTRKRIGEGIANSQPEDRHVAMNYFTPVASTV